MASEESTNITYDNTRIRSISSILDTTENEQLLPKKKKQKLNENDALLSPEIAIFSSSKSKQFIIEYHTPFCSCNGNSNLCMLTDKMHHTFSFRRTMHGFNSDEEEANEDDDDFSDIPFQNTWPLPLQRLWLNRKVNPNAFYYRFTRETQKSGEWDMNDHKLFMQRVMEFGVNNEWGIFSKGIPGRCGFQCANYWSRLIEKYWVNDMNVYEQRNRVSGKTRLITYDWDSKTIPDKIRKFSLFVFKDPSETFDIGHHPKCCDDAEISKHLPCIPIYMNMDKEYFVNNICASNDALSHAHDVSLVILSYIEPNRVGWIARWAVDLLKPLIIQKRIEICTEPNSIALHQIKIKQTNEYRNEKWPVELQEYIKMSPH
eukprot:91306_1